ncbi:hypothetical protein FCL40_12115 [Ferrimonas sediminicola]|uniref:Uncharacterized protein n=1 Tax=Ferrimonas sediminicola TaxID=2569538 RepID=A0A4U1BDQ7_9GAMM|nr:hypothetical protein [Ferrimonas sediminicola]TKB48449.1 hypothetical protein FCL40_12115 [Ferrimonas sediminicola]
MEQNSADNLAQPALTSEALLAQLSGTSPLQASSVLINLELYEQRESLQVLESVYQEFDSKSSLMDELLKPVALSVLDGIISHKDLKLNRTGLSASRVWNEVQQFDYGEGTTLSNDATQSRHQLDALRTPRDYDDKVRATMTKESNRERHKQSHFGTAAQGYSDLEVNQDGSRVRVYRKQDRAMEVGSYWRAVDTDHVVPVKQINDRYANNAFLNDADMVAITDGEFNLVEISNRFNRSKGDSSFSDMVAEKRQLEAKQAGGARLSAKERSRLAKLTLNSDDTYDAAVEKQHQAERAIHAKAQQQALKNLKENGLEVGTKAGIQAGEQSAYQAMGHGIIALIKPLLHELMDAVRHGFAEGVGAESATEGLKLRVSRVMRYFVREVLPTLKQGIKDLINNFVKILIEGVLGLVTGMFKTVLKVISEGFSALVGAGKILMQPDSAMSRAQKADAIVKLFAATAASFVVFYFESSILAALPKGFIKDIALSTLSGVASVVVVYLLNQADLFSTKAELRSRRVAEIFEHRVKQIKLNTDAFETAAVTKLAQDKLAFMAISERMQGLIEADEDVNPAVEQLARSFNIELSVKETDEFLNLLESSDALLV